MNDIFILPSRSIPSIASWKHNRDSFLLWPDDPNRLLDPIPQTVANQVENRAVFGKWMIRRYYKIQPRLTLTKLRGQWKPSRHCIYQSTHQCWEHSRCISWSEHFRRRPRRSLLTGTDFQISSDHLPTQNNKQEYAENCKQQSTKPVWIRTKNHGVWI